ncbi:MAG TPA: 4'-phosphopantetheinyl transferase superfamily protein [Kofleriaceae bacterium]
MAIDVYRIRLAHTAMPGCANAALRAIVAMRLGREVELAIDPRGKPQLAGRELEVNVSHSGELALIAISDAGAIGVDVEQVRPLHDARAFIKRFFSAAEAAEAGDELAAIFRTWCRKEALLKARGIGLVMPLAAVDVRSSPPGWLLADLDVAPGYAAAVARAGEPAELRIIDYSDDNVRDASPAIARNSSR